MDKQKIHVDQSKRKVVHKNAKIKVCLGCGHVGYGAREFPYGASGLCVTCIRDWRERGKNKKKRTFVSWCNYCGKYFGVESKLQVRTKRGGRKVCDECQHRKPQAVQVECETCGKKYKISSWQYRKNKRFFCSRQCMPKAKARPKKLPVLYWCCCCGVASPMRHQQCWEKLFNRLATPPIDIDEQRRWRSKLNTIVSTHCYRVVVVKQTKKKRRIVHPNQVDLIWKQKFDGFATKGYTGKREMTWNRKLHNLNSSCKKRLRRKQRMKESPRRGWRNCYSINAKDAITQVKY